MRYNICMLNDQILKVGDEYLDVTEQAIYKKGPESGIDEFVIYTEDRQGKSYYKIEPTVIVYIGDGPVLVSTETGKPIT